MPPRTRSLIIPGIIVVVLLLILGGYLLLTQDTNATTEAVEDNLPNIEPLPAKIELADTAEKRTQGLSGRDAIDDDYGMLFVFPMDDRHSFWMKDMQFPIDIIWLSSEGTIVHIERSLSPATYPKMFTPPVPARYVLEVRAGYAQKRAWEVGTKLDLSAY